MIRKIGNEWWTAPTESDENGRTVIVTGRRGVEAAMESGKYRIRVEITWRYQGDSTGMPDKPTSMLMEAVQEALTKVFDRDPVAILTGVYTGDDRRDWVFYVTSTHIFERKINEALAPFDLLPITIYTENDPDWAEYREMREATELTATDEYASTEIKKLTQESACVSFLLYTDVVSGVVIEFGILCGNYLL